ncbi:hypothetical protein NHJ13051_008777 [Beauveria bassiana]
MPDNHGILHAVSIRGFHPHSSLLSGVIRHDIQRSRDSPELNLQTPLVPRLNLSEKHLPQILILDFGTGARRPPIAYPASNPRRGALGDIFRVSGEYQRRKALASPVPEAECRKDSSKLSPVTSLGGFVSRWSFLLKAPRRNAGGLVGFGLKDECPSRSRAGLSVVETGTIGIDQ